MLERGKISAQQMAILSYPIIVATAVLLVPAISGKYAHQDMWLSPIWGAFAGFLTFIVIYRLHKHYPNETVIQFCTKIIGTIPGKIIGFIILSFTWYSTGIALREYGEFVIGNFLPETPLIVVLGSMAFICALTVHAGLETMARSAQVFVPIIVLLFLFILILLLPDLDPKHLLPIMENGVSPSIIGAFAPSAWFNELFILSFVLPYLKKKEKGLKWGMITVFAVMITLVISNLFSLFLFGNTTSSFTYPVMDAARYISIADFLQHVEAIVMAIWVAGVFVKVSVFLYAIVLGTAQWLHLSDYRPIIFPVTLFVIIGSIWSAANLQELTRIVSTAWSFLSFVVYLFLPTFLLLVSVVRKKTAKRQQA